MITMAMDRIQKQPFVNIFQNRCSEEFRNINRKPPELVSHQGKEKQYIHPEIRLVLVQLIPRKIIPRNDQLFTVTCN